jgi:hypothetical protein
MPTKITKTQLQGMIRKAIQEQVDMRSKDGRELKDLAAQIIRQQQDLEAYTQSIQAVLGRQKELQNAAAASQKALFGRMQALDVKTLEITEAVFRIEDEAKYKRVEPGYKPLYEKAIEELARFSAEQVRVVEAMRETEVNLKKAERVTTMKITRKESAQKATSNKKALNEQMMDKVVSWLKNVWSRLTNAVGSALSAADTAILSLRDL